jgi:uncharacterized protein (DUF1501 family)
MERRAFLKHSALAAFGLGTSPAWLTRAALASNTARGKRVLVVIFQRGAMDGLSAVAPFGEERYRTLRPTLALPAPRSNESNALIDLDGFFGLHPALRTMEPLWASKQLAAIHASGSPDPTRSHFDAQDFMESGTPGRKSTQDGWLNRALAPRADASPLRAVSLGGSLARSLRGSNGAVSIETLASFGVKEANESFNAMYSRSADRVLQGTSKDAFAAEKLIASMQRNDYKPAGGARYPQSRLGQGLQQIARLIKADAGLEVAFADTLGWDTHIGQAPLFQNLLRDFGESLLAFHRDMGDRMSDVAVVTMSEFGRAARENGNRGTDHGHANVMFALGAGIQGGKVHGRWPGLNDEQLYERRDLAVTTDFRDVLSTLLRRHLGVQDMSKVFPGYTPAALPGLV